MVGLNSQTIPIIAASVVLFVVVLYRKPKRWKLFCFLSMIVPPSVFLLGLLRSVATHDQIERPWYLIAIVTTLFYSSVCCAIILALEQLRQRTFRNR